MRFASSQLILLLVCSGILSVQGCQHGQLSKVLESCDEYNECSHGNLIRKRCDIGQHFDGEKCDDFWKANCKQEPCIEGMIYQRGDCKIDYDVCVDGKLERNICPALYRYNGTYCIPMEFCVVPTKCKQGEVKNIQGYTYMQCDNGEFITKFCQQGYKFVKSANSCQPINTEMVLRYGFCVESDRQVVGDCSKYRECVRGRYADKECPKDMLFDKNYLICRFRWDAVCGDDSCVTGRKSPNPNDCKSYFTCKDGEKQLNNCGWFFGWYFDPVQEKCTYISHCERTTCKGEWTKVNGDCSEYTVCNNGYQITYSCGLGEKYSYEKKACVVGLKCEQPNALFLKNDCIDGQTRRIYGRCSEYEKCVNRKWRQMKCPKGTNFQTDQCENKPCPLMPVLNHCPLFKQPDTQQAFECPIGHLFDSIVRQCVCIAAARCADGECVDNELSNHPTDCQKYKQCENGEWMVKSCPAYFNHFDIVDKKCKYFSYKCRYDTVNCTEGVLRPDASDCSKYEQCVSKSWRSQSCAFYKHFDARTNQCAIYSYKCFQSDVIASQSRNSQVKQVERMQQVNVLAAECKEGEKKIIENTCRWYKECENGKIITKKCSPCTNFNTDTNTCEYVWKKPCPSDVTDPPDMTTSPPITVPTQPVTPTTKRAACKEGDKRGILGDCSLYQVCLNGKWSDEKCSAWGKFDVVTKQCTYIEMWKVTCA